MITFARRSLARVVKSAKAPAKAAEKGLDINTETELIKFLNDEGIPVSLNVGKVVEIGNTEMSKVAERKLKKMKRDSDLNGSLKFVEKFIEIMAKETRYLLDDQTDLRRSNHKSLSF